MSNERNNFFRHTAIYLLARGLPGIIAFLAIPLYTRLLDPAGYGKFALVVATTNLLGALFFQGLLLALVRFLPAYKSDPARLKSTLLTATLLLIAAAGVAAGIICLLPAARPWRMVIIGGWFLLTAQQSFDFFGEYSRAQIRPWRYMSMQLVRAAIATTLGATLIALGAGWMGALLGAGIAAMLPVFYVYRRDWSDTRLRLNREVLAVVCRYSIPLSLTIATAVIIASSDRFLIAWLMGEEAAGLYSVGADLTARTLSVLMMVVYTAVFPLAVRAWEEGGPDAARERMRYNASLLLGIGLPAVVGLAMLAGNIAQCFLGQSFRSAAAGVIPLIALGGFLAGFKAYHCDAAFHFAQRTILQVWIVLVAAVVNVSLNWIFIPRFGINGAAGASVIAYTVSIALAASIGRRYFALPFPLRPFMQVVTAAALMALALYPLRSYRGGGAMTMQVATGFVAYGGALLALNFLGLRESLVAKLPARPRRDRSSAHTTTTPVLEGAR